MKGSCLCGAVRFEVRGTAKGASVCHCSQCRKQSGHQWASAFVPDRDLSVMGDIRWYQSSKNARRGFCPVCGSFLFWKNAKDDHVSFALGALDGATGIRLEKHIFTAEKGDYYDICDGLKQT